MKIKIVKVSKDTLWYKDHIGSIFKVKKPRSNSEWLELMDKEANKIMDEIGVWGAALLVLREDVVIL